MYHQQCCVIQFVSFIIGLFATFFSLWSTVPQIRKVLRTKEAEDVSNWLIIYLILGLSLWVVYGISKDDVIIAGSNSIGVSLNVCLLVLKFKYTKQADS